MRAYFAVSNFVYESNDPDSVARFSTSSCAACNFFIRVIRTQVVNHEHLAGGRYVLLRVTPASAMFGLTQLVAVRVRVGRQRLVGPHGVIEVIPAVPPTTLAVTCLWANGRWYIARIFKP